MAWRREETDEIFLEPHKQVEMRWKVKSSPGNDMNDFAGYLVVFVSTFELCDTLPAV